MGHRALKRDNKPLQIYVPSLILMNQVYIHFNHLPTTGHQMTPWAFSGDI